MSWYEDWKKKREYRKAAKEKVEAIYQANYYQALEKEMATKGKNDAAKINKPAPKASDKKMNTGLTGFLKNVSLNYLDQYGSSLSPSITHRPKTKKVRQRKKLRRYSTKSHDPYGTW